MTFCHSAVFFDTQAPPVFFMVVMLLMGITVIVIRLTATLMQRRRCTEKIHAVCSHIDTKYRNRAIVHCPTYTFRYQSKRYSVCDGSYSNVGVPALGATVTLYINPDDPDTFYCKSAAKDAFVYCIGGFLILISTAYFLSR